MWPTRSDYIQALSRPHYSFALPALKAGRVPPGNLNLPYLITGRFACVSQIECTDGVYAIRMFLEQQTERAERYQAISDCLGAKPPWPFVSFHYVEQGIMAAQDWRPILTMEWVEGEGLRDYVDRLVKNGSVVSLKALAMEWDELMLKLWSMSIAHGDLHHDNVKFTKDGLRLIDYDGMFVPALQGSQSYESGLGNYQHPDRADHSYFGPELDRFAGLVIRTALYALSERPDFWHLFSQDDSLLFTTDDYTAAQNGEESPLFQALLHSSLERVRDGARLLFEACRMPLDQMPAWDHLLHAPASPLSASTTKSGKAARSPRPQATQLPVARYLTQDYGLFIHTDPPDQNFHVLLPCGQPLPASSFDLHEKLREFAIDRNYASLSLFCYQGDGTRRIEPDSGHRLLGILSLSNLHTGQRLLIDFRTDNERQIEVEVQDKATHVRLTNVTFVTI